MRTQNKVGRLRALFASAKKRNAVHATKRRKRSLGASATKRNAAQAVARRKAAKYAHWAKFFRQKRIAFDNAAHDAWHAAQSRERVNAEYQYECWLQENGFGRRRRNQNSQEYGESYGEYRQRLLAETETETSNQTNI